MPFKPGQSGNPKGRPPDKAIAEVKTLALKHTPAAIKELARIASTGESEAARVSAIKELLDRAVGKASQPVGGATDLPAIVHIIEQRIVHADR